MVYPCSDESRAFTNGKTSMTETLSRPHPSSTAAPATQFTCFWLYQRAESWYDVPASTWADADTELLALLNDSDAGYAIRGVYSLVGIRPEVDVMIWGIAPTLDKLQELAVKVGRTTIGRHLRLRQAYYGMGGMSTYDPTHGPAFIKGDAPRRYLSVYPFTKTPAWFQLPYPERRQLMVEHGQMGREFPTVLTNTVSSFGIADQDWVVALEDDDPKVLIAMVQKLREAKVREWTAIDTPIYLGERKAPEAVLADLHG
jgi:chlorite dismutase